MAEELILALLLVHGLLAVLASLGGLQFHTPLALEAFALLCPQLAWQVLTPNRCQVATLSHVMCLFSASFLSLSKRKSHGQFQTRSRTHSRPWENVTTSGRQLGDIICKRSGRQLDSTTSGETLEALEATGRQHLGSRIWVTFGRQLWHNWETTGWQLEHNWKTSGRQLGDKRETTCGRQMGVVGDKLKTTRRQLGGRKHLANHIIWTTSDDICETTGRRGCKVPQNPAPWMGKGRGKSKYRPLLLEIGTRWTRKWETLGDTLADKAGRQGGRRSAVGDTVFYTMKNTVTVGDSVAGNVQGARHSGGQSGRQSGRRSAVGDTVGDKAEDTAGRHVGDKWEIRWETQWEMALRNMRVIAPPNSAPTQPHPIRDVAAITYAA